MLRETTEEGESGLVLSLVRTTRLMGFADDIRVFLQTTAVGTKIDVTSQSRVGKGDLGQNPRNVREVLTALRKLGLDQPAGR